MNVNNRQINRPDIPRPLTPVLPLGQAYGPLKDLAQEAATASARLEGHLALETGRVLGEKLRLANSYYSNLIEGHRTTLPDIENALQGRYERNESRRYAQELCRAHVQCERWIMAQIEEEAALNVAQVEFLCAIHAEFYRRLPPEHLFAHYGGGFTDLEVRPGALRDYNVSVKDGLGIGPDPDRLPAMMEDFGRLFDPAAYHGDDKLLAMAVAHHRLAWLHPFRDGNGRVARLFTGACLARIGINRCNLWSLSRGFSRQRTGYMFNLDAADQPAEPGETGYFSLDMTADFAFFFLRICLDQIGFMAGLLELEQVERRMEAFVRLRRDDPHKPLHPASSRLLRAVFLRGSLRRGQAGTVTNLPERSARRVVAQLLDQGLLTSPSAKGELHLGLPAEALSHYFPRLVDPGMAQGEEAIL